MSASPQALHHVFSQMESCSSLSLAKKSLSILMPRSKSAIEVKNGFYNRRNVRFGSRAVTRVAAFGQKRTTTRQ